MFKSITKEFRIRMSRPNALTTELTAMTVACAFFVPAGSFVYGSPVALITGMILISGILATYVVVSDTFLGLLYVTPTAILRNGLCFAAFAGVIATIGLYPLEGPDIVAVQSTAAIALSLVLRLGRNGHSDFG